MTFKSKRARREDVVATIIDWSSIFQVTGSIRDRNLVKDLAVDGRRHFRDDGDIVVVDHVVGRLRDLKKVGVDPDRPTNGAKGRSANVTT